MTDCGRVIYKALSLLALPGSTIGFEDFLDAITAKLVPWMVLVWLDGTSLPTATGNPSSEGDKESRDGIHKIFNLFDDDKTGTAWEDRTYFNPRCCLKIQGPLKSTFFVMYVLDTGTLVVSAIFWATGRTFCCFFQVCPCPVQDDQPEESQESFQGIG